MGWPDGVGGGYNARHSTASASRITLSLSDHKVYKSGIVSLEYAIR
jgi:hypothetical protein